MRQESMRTSGMDLDDDENRDRFAVVRFNSCFRSRVRSAATAGRSRVASASTKLANSA